LFIAKTDKIYMEANTQQRKEQVRVLLKTRNMSALAEWAQNDRNIMRILMTYLYDRDETVYWRAIEGLATVATQSAENDMDSVRRILQRLFWSMNDESGSVGWHAPEAIGEILAKVPALIEEYGLILGSFMREEPFERGVHCALARIIPLKPEIFAGLKADLVQSLNDPDQSIRGYTLLALKGMGDRYIIMSAASLVNDHAIFSAYDWDTGTMKTKIVSDIAQELLKS
jgi:hypothetical protein